MSTSVATLLKLTVMCNILEIDDFYGTGEAAAVVLPWERGIRLISLLDMLQYPVDQLGTCLAGLRLMESQLESLIRTHKEHRDSPVDAQVRNLLLIKIATCQKHCQKLEMTAALSRIERIHSPLNARISNDNLRHELRVLRETMQADLSQRRFAFVPTEKATKLDNIDKDWGDVQKHFAKAKDDIHDAIECYALDCNTACVFHSMRVAERGLRALAKTLGITNVGKQQHPLEFAEWGPILNALKGKLKDLQQSPGRGPKKAALTTFYADAASQADYLNEIWRKEVSHARGQYNAPEALNALMRTRDFMSLLSQRISEKKRGSTA